MPTTNQPVIPVFFAIDDNYAPYLSVALVSLIKNASQHRQYEINILSDQLNAQHQAELAALATKNVHIQVVAMRPKFKQTMQAAHGKLRGDYETLTIYFRLFIADLFPQYDRAVYLDADVVLNSDVADLYDQPLADNLIAAVPDTFAADHAETITYVEQALGIPIGQYMNSGVLVINMAAWRAHGFSDQFLHLLNTYNFNVLAPDQDYLNLMTQGHILQLPATWNAMPSHSTVVKNPALIHYSLFNKPWHYDDVANDNYFWYYAEQSPDIDQIVLTQAAYDEADKEKDRATEQGLLKAALAVVMAGETNRLIAASKKAAVL
ncbi:glycosyltransferase family 8 protein [Lactiplantibacillus fabifermentans]|nr:glycosyltransferase family 8 protein [Lactiplantibacillus fabifermentans]ETY74419.1 glycosyl transferase [Lactiplantibacillus fabifermentans T30PCM01]